MGNKMCSRILERFLEGVEIFGKRDFTILCYASDSDLIGGKNHKTLANLGKSALAGEYERHIPKCQECLDTYIGFLKRQTDENTIGRTDKKYFGLLPNSI